MKLAYPHWLTCKISLLGGHSKVRCTVILVFGQGVCTVTFISNITFLDTMRQLLTFKVFFVGSHVQSWLSKCSLISRPHCAC